LFLREIKAALAFKDFGKLMAQTQSCSDAGLGASANGQTWMPGVEKEEGRL
jgi:hypothetical protein